MKTKSYSTGKKCCKEHKSIITVRQIGNSFETECDDCSNKITGKKQVTNFILS